MPLRFSWRLIREQYADYTLRQLATTLLPTGKEEDECVVRASEMESVAWTPHSRTHSRTRARSNAIASVCILLTFTYVASLARAYRALRMWSMGSPLSIVARFIISRVMVACVDLACQIEKSRYHVIPSSVDKHISLKLLMLLCKLLCDCWLFESLISW